MGIFDFLKNHYFKSGAETRVEIKEVNNKNDVPATWHEQIEADINGINRLLKDHASIIVNNQIVVEGLLARNVPPPLYHEEIEALVKRIRKLEGFDDDVYHEA